MTSYRVALVSPLAAMVFSGCDEVVTVRSSPSLPYAEHCKSYLRTSAEIIANYRDVHRTLPATEEGVAVLEKRNQLVLEKTSNLIKYVRETSTTFCLICLADPNTTVSPEKIRTVPFKWNPDGRGGIAGLYTGITYTIDGDGLASRTRHVTYP